MLHHMNSKPTRVLGIAIVRMECSRAQCLYENWRQHEGEVSVYHNLPACADL